VTSAETVVLGAGLTGLSAAYHLGGETVVVEREPWVGGLCASAHVGGFTFDRTGHVLHLRDAWVRRLVQTLLPDAFVEVERRALVYSKGVHTAYPFQVNTYGLPEAVVRECLAGFLETRRAEAGPPPAEFGRWIVHTFGEGIARHFLAPYNAKLYRVDLATLDAEAMAVSIPRPTAAQVLQGSRGQEVAGLGYNATFLYPRRGGIEIIAAALAARCGDVRLNRTVCRVDPLARRVEIDGGETLEYERLVSTIPLDSLLAILDPVPDPVFVSAPRRLHAIRVVSFNLGIERERVLPGHWVYFPEPEFPFYRVVSASNYAERVAPRGCSSLSVEVARRRDEPVDLEALRAEVLEGLARARILRSSDRILAEETRVLDPAYVIHDHQRRHTVPRVLAALQRYGIVSTGRYGAWEYGSMETALRQGHQAAERVKPARRQRSKAVR
jgi:protoporphyrinogen oxidase